MLDNSFPESKIQWFLDKFKNEKGEIIASDIRKKGGKIYSNSDWRRLMSLTVQKGYAKDNGKYSKNNKYGIYLTSGKKVIFDVELMIMLIEYELPPSILIDDLTDNQKLFYKMISERWCKIYESFVRYQFNKDVELLSEDEDFNEMISIKAKKFICLYKLIKIGWQEIVRNFPKLSGTNHNKFFSQILLMNSIMEFTQAISEDASHPRSDYKKQKKRMTVIRNKYCDPGEAVEILGKKKYDLIMGEETDKSNIFPKSSFVQSVMSKSSISQELILLRDWLAMGDFEAWKFAECHVIKELLANQDNPQIKEILEDLLRAEDALLEYELYRQRRNLDEKEEYLQRRQWSKDGNLTN